MRLKKCCITWTWLSDMYLTSPNELSYLCRKYGHSVGFANGCFDVLHDGHIYFLKEARKLCDVLFIGLNSDDSIRKLKGDGRPANNFSYRHKALMNTGLMDFIAAFNNEDELAEVIAAVKPNYLIKGEEYRGKPVTGSDEIIGCGGSMIYIPRMGNHSTTSMLASSFR